MYKKSVLYLNKLLFQISPKLNILCTSAVKLYSAESNIFTPFMCFYVPEFIEAEMLPTG